MIQVRFLYRLLQYIRRFFFIDYILTMISESEQKSDPNDNLSSGRDV